MTKPPPIAPEDEPSYSSEKEFVRPSYTFKGKTLAPFSRGAKMLYGMVMHEADSVSYRILALIFILSREREEVANLCWDLAKFRAAIADYRDTLTDKDEEEASRIYKEIIEAELQSRVELVPSAGTRKKKERSRRATPPG